VIPTRESPVGAPNVELQPLPPVEHESNSAWVARSPLKSGIVLLGGTSLVDFRVRVAQSALRSDLSPSYWSVSGLIRDDGTIRTVPLQPADVNTVPLRNAVREMSMGDFDNADDWPNIAVLRFAANEEVVQENADRVSERRTIIDLPALLLAWLAHVWVTDEQINPLAAGKGVPSAAFVEAAYSLAGIELTPGLASTASCPEAIWQSVKWWHEYYAGVAEIGTAAEAGAVVPDGWFCLRQRSAQMRLAPDAPLFLPQPDKPPVKPDKPPAKPTKKESPK
jgi:hypothetical protein